MGSNETFFRLAGRCVTSCIYSSGSPRYVDTLPFDKRWSGLSNRRLARQYLGSLFQPGCRSFGLTVPNLRPRRTCTAHLWFIVRGLHYCRTHSLFRRPSRALAGAPHIETQRIYSRLYLAIVLSTIYFPTAVIVGYGLWLIWLAIIVERTRTVGQATLATAAFGVALAFTHPSIALLGLLYVAVGATLNFFGRSVPRRSLIAVAVMSTILLVAYLGTSRWLAATNPTVLVALTVHRYDFINPAWMATTVVLFPALAAQWLLLLAPGTQSAHLRWYLGRPAILIITVLGLWFAAAGTGLLTWLYARHTAGYILAMALALALVSPEAWVKQARRPLLAYAAVVSAAVISYNVDLFLFGRFVDARATAGIVDVDRPGYGWPPALDEPSSMRGYFKWGIGPNYQRDVVVPIYDWYEITLAFYSFYHSDRQSILFHRLDPPGSWLPYFCSAVARTLAEPHDPQDRWFLTFIGEHYCVP